MLFDNYDPFVIMVILLFIYFMLILFIFMIIYNTIHRNKQYNKLQKNSNNLVPSTTCASCIPSPTPLPGNKQFY